jgi:hypothetical protein
METDKAWIVLIIVIGIILGANGLTFLIAHGSRNMRFDWLIKASQMKGGRSKEDADWDELSKRVKDLKSKETPKGDE